jgi:hypothetical protein
MFYCQFSEKDNKQMEIDALFDQVGGEGDFYVVILLAFPSVLEYPSNTIEGVKLIVARKSDHHHPFSSPKPSRNRFMIMSNICPSNKCGCEVRTSTLCIYLTSRMYIRGDEKIMKIPIETLREKLSIHPAKYPTANKREERTALLCAINHRIFKSSSIALIECN